MLPVSKPEFRASQRGELPGLEETADGVFVAALPIPHGHIPYTLTYVIIDAEGAAHVIDPGWNSDENFALLGRHLTRVGSGIEAVRSIIVTHMHADHLGMALRLREASPSKVVLHEREQEALDALLDSPAPTPAERTKALHAWGVPDDRQSELLAVPRMASTLARFTADVLLAADDTLDIPGHELQIIHTPGHTPGHISLRDASRGLLFTGDHILPTVYSGIGLGGASATNPIADYLDSLDRVAPFDGDAVLPGHGYRFTGLGDRRRDIEQHHLTRSREVDVIAGRLDNPSVWQVAERVSWSGGWENLSPFNRLSAVNQTELHLEFVRSAAGQARL